MSNIDTLEQRLSLLVVDGDADIASQVRELLPDSYDVLAARTISEAEARLASGKIAIMLCNEYLEEENGLFFMARIRKDHPNLQPVLMSEGVTEDLLAFAINDIGVLKYVRKPLKQDELASAVSGAAELHAKAIEAETLKLQYERMQQEMQGLPYRIKRFRRAARVVVTHSRDFMVASASTIIALQGLFLGLGLVTLGILYVLKSMLGINILADMHLGDLFF